MLNPNMMLCCSSLVTKKEPRKLKRVFEGTSEMIMMARHLVICCMAEETHRFLQETDWKERLVNDLSL